MKVVCKKNIPIIGDETFQKLTIGREYYVFGIECSDFRIIDDEFNPYLFNRDRFIVIDELIPPEWHKYYEDMELYCYPKEIERPGFFEDYFDYIEETIIIFEKLVRKYDPTNEYLSHNNYLKRRQRNIGSTETE